MSVAEEQDLIGELDHILEEERAALIAGEFSGIEALVARKEAAVAALNDASGLDAGALARVQDRAERNRELLNSAMQGIRAVADRMAELRRVRKGLDVYDQTGRKASYGTRPSGSLEKRA